METEEKFRLQTVHMRNKSLKYSISKEKQNVMLQYLVTTFHLRVPTHGDMVDGIVYKVREIRNLEKNDFQISLFRKLA